MSRTMSCFRLLKSATTFESQFYAILKVDTCPVTSQHHRNLNLVPQLLFEGNLQCLELYVWVIDQA